MGSKLVDTLNRLSDLDGGWAGVIQLRPRREDDMTDKIVAQIAVRFGPLMGLLPVVLPPRHGHSLGWKVLLVSIPLMTLLYFLAYRLTFAWAWNIRARSLRDAAARRATGPGP
jgi:hypothetical protein